MFCQANTVSADLQQCAVLCVRIFCLALLHYDVCVRVCVCVCVCACVSLLLGRPWMLTCGKQHSTSSSHELASHILFYFLFPLLFSLHLLLLLHPPFSLSFFPPYSNGIK